MGRQITIAFYIVLMLPISNKFKQNQMQNVDFVHFQQIALSVQAATVQCMYTIICNINNGRCRQILYCKNIYKWHVGSLYKWQLILNYMIAKIGILKLHHILLVHTLYSLIQFMKRGSIIILFSPMTENLKLFLRSPLGL